MSSNNSGLYEGGKRPTCKICGSEDKFDFNVRDEVWKQVVPSEYENKVVCLDCFDKLAFEKKIDYSDCIDVLYFTGDQATFKFRTVSAQDG
jgi:hypothetical protein